MSKKAIGLCLAVFLICISIVAWAGEKSVNRVASERLIVQIDPSSWIRESFKVSPDSKRVAYVAEVGNKWFVVVNGEEGKRYDGIVTLGGGRIIFDFPDSFHYLALKGSSIYLVEEKIK
ncbi:hypothetical protein KAV79_04385 [Candidatus Aerophobetes bacterium]|nr:hypothetical protein [Candidatus Aerophobetes bacterium]